MQSRVKFLVSTSVLSVFALILTYVEALVPINAAIPVPGFKLGLSNIVVAYVLTREPISAFLILLLKVSLSALLFGSPISLLFSLCGGLLSFLVMLAVHKLLNNKISFLGIGTAGAFFHNVGQLVITALIYGYNVAFAYGTPMLLSGIICGGALGLTLNLFSERICKIVEKMC